MSLFDDIAPNQYTPATASEQAVDALKNLLRNWIEDNLGTGNPAPALARLKEHVPQVVDHVNGELAVMTPEEDDPLKGVTRVDGYLIRPILDAACREIMDAYSASQPDASEEEEV